MKLTRPSIVIDLGSIGRAAYPSDVMPRTECRSQSAAQPLQKHTGVIRHRKPCIEQLWRIALLLAATASCGKQLNHADVALEDNSVPFQTDRPSYTLSPNAPEATIVVRYENPHSFAVYFKVCGFKNVDDNPPAMGTKPVSEVVSANTGADSDLGLEWACLYAPRRIVGSGGVLVDSVPIHLASAQRAVTGPYLVVYRVYDRPSSSERDEEGLLPLVDRRTNIFMVAIPEN